MTAAPQKAKTRRAPANKPPGKKAAKRKPAAKVPPKKPAAAKRTPRRLSVVASTGRDVVAIAGEHKHLARGALAAAALALARDIDNTETPAAAKASCVRQLRATLDDLHRAAATARLEQLRKAAANLPAPAEKSEPKDRVVDLRNRREARRAGGANPTN